MPSGIPKNGINKGWFKFGKIGFWAGKKRPNMSGENNPQWKGGSVKKKCLICGKEFEMKRPQGLKAKYCSRKCTGIAKKELIGKKGSNWKGNKAISPLYKRIKLLSKYKQWRKAVFERDNYTCVICHKVGGILNPRHIKHFSVILKENNLRTIEQAINCKELWDINNGITLCKDCHKLKHKHKF